MKKILDYIIAEKEWLFSGLGIIILGVFFKKKSNSANKMKQKISKNSKGIQANGNVNYNSDKN